MAVEADFVSDLNSYDQGARASEGLVSANGPGAMSPNEAVPVRLKDTPAADTEVKSLRDQISSALKGEEATPAAAARDGGPVRGPDGKFAKPDPIAPGTPGLAVDAAAQPAGTGVEPQPGTALVPAGIDPQVFNALPAETQAQLARTMDELNGKAAQYKSYDQIEQMIAPRRQPWALNGMTEAQALNQLLALSDFATNDPKGFTKYFAEQSGVDLEDIIFGEDSSPTIDPTVKALQEQLAQVQQRVDYQDQTAQNAAHASTVQQVQSFFDAQDANGVALRPYANEVVHGIMPFVVTARDHNPNRPMNDILQEAYDTACWAIPAVRGRMQEAAEASREAERLQASTAKVRQARLAGSSVGSGVPSVAPAQADASGVSLRDTIRNVMAAAS